MNLLAPFQLLELNIISAQDLEPVCRRKMRTYAVAWVHQERKLSTRIDSQGHNSPTWNDKFVFRVDDEFLYGDTSAVMIEIYAVHWFRDIHVGTVRAIVGNLVPPVPRSNRRHEVQLGMRFVALQVRRPSGRPQGILNIGVALLDSSMRSMPLYLQMGSSAVGYRHLMGEEDPFQNSTNNLPSCTTKSITHKDQISYNAVPELRRTKSDSSSIVAPEFRPRKSMEGSSIINGGSIVYGGGSMVNGSEIGKNNRVNSRGSSMVNYVFDKKPKKNDKGSSIVNEFEDPGKRGPENVEKYKNVTKTGLKTPPKSTDSDLKFHVLDYETPKKLGRPPMLTDSELGPSPSEVAAAVARNMHYNNKFDDKESSIDGWSLDESIEGLRSKLERWRTELPPLYDRGEISSFMSSGIPTTTDTSKKASRHARRHTDAGGLFSCFGNICGCEISITCGPGAAAAAAASSRKKGKRMRRSPSYDTFSYL